MVPLSRGHMASGLLLQPYVWYPLTAICLVFSCSHMSGLLPQLYGMTSSATASCSNILCSSHMSWHPVQQPHSLRYPVQPNLVIMTHLLHVETGSPQSHYSEHKAHPMQCKNVVSRRRVVVSGVSISMVAISGSLDLLLQPHVLELEPKPYIRVWEL